MRKGASMNSRGFSMAELIVTVAVIAIVMAVSAPVLASHLRTSALRAGADELVASLTAARQLAIKDNTTVCVTNDGAGVRLRVGGCGAPVWTGAGTESDGRIRLTNGIQVSSATNVVFDYMGKATTFGTYTVTNPVDGTTLPVTVTFTGRVKVGS